MRMIISGDMQELCPRAENAKPASWAQVGGNRAD